MNNIRDVLVNLGFRPVDDKDGYRMAAIYRNGDNPTALKVFKDNGNWIDFVENTRGSLEDLIKACLGGKINPKEWLKNQDINIERKSYVEKINIPEIFNQSLLNELIKDYTYITNRGISLETAQLFSCGVCLNSQTLLQKLRNRQVFCIYNSRKQLVGFSGRTLDDKHKLKYKHIGSKNNWVYPAYLNHDVIKETQEIIIVEGIFDVMRLWDMNIKNTLCLFGIELSHAILNYLLKMHPKAIIISTNNEINSSNGGVGNEAAIKIYNRLKRYFNPNQLKIHLPPCKDFADSQCSDEIIKEWYHNK